MALNLKNLTFICGGASAVAGGGAGIYLLSQDKTIEHELISVGETLIKEDNEYLVAFKEHKSNKGDDETIVDNSEVSKGQAALKKWCKDNLKLDLTPANIDKSFANAKKYCTKPPMTIGARIAKLGKEVTDWKVKLEDLKKTKINEAIAKEINKQTDKFDENDLKAWCQGNYEKNLVDNSTDAIWAKVKERCLKK